MTVEHVAICNRCRGKQDIPEMMERPVGWVKIHLPMGPGTAAVIDLCSKCADELRDWIIRHE